MPTRMSLAEAAARARHDLGKYIAFQTRWVGVDAPAAELREALRADLLNTRAGPGGCADAMSVWRTLRNDLAPAGIDEIERRMLRLELLAGALDTLAEPGLREAARLALEVAEELRALHRRVGG